MSDASWVPVDSYGWVFDVVVAIPLAVVCVLLGLLIRSAIRHSDAQRAVRDARRDREWYERHRERLYRLGLHQELREDQRRNSSVFDRL